jgi:undecaprenyl-diphosphooligosaccharide--protein glycosyltransferase
MTFRSVLSFEERLSWRWAIALILLAWLFTAGLRYVWIADAKGQPSRMWNGQPITNNRDSYLFGCVLQKACLGMHRDNAMVPGVMDEGIITAAPYLLSKVVPISIDALMIYGSVLVATLITVPIILIGRLYGSTSWGLLAALLAGIANSYYNRTLAGYFDTDMVSVTVPTVALYFLLAASRRERLLLAWAGSLTLFLYPFFYRPGLPVGYALGLAYIAYRILALGLAYSAYRLLTRRRGALTWTWRRRFWPILRILSHRRVSLTWSSTALVSIALAAATLSKGPTLAATPWLWLLALGGLLALFEVFRRNLLPRNVLIGTALVALTGFVLFAGPVRMILSRTHQLQSAQDRLQRQQRTDDTTPRLAQRLQFLNTLTTVRETKRIKFDRIAVRITGSQIGSVLALIGYLLLVVRHPEMLIAAPLAGIGLFAYSGGLRFTIFAIPIAALSVVFLLFALAAAVALFVRWLAAGALPIPGVDSRRPGSVRQVGRARRRRARSSKPAAHPSWLQAIVRAIDRVTSWNYWPALVAAVGTVLLLIPNVQHIFAYRVPVILAHDAVAALDTLHRSGSSDDFVITWWDYGSAAWYYSGCQTLNSPASNTSPDNFLVSKILSTDSQRQAANLCRTSVEKFVAKQGRKAAIKAILRRRSDDPVDPNQFLADTASLQYRPPPKTRDVYLFIPVEMLRMFPAVHAFSNRDLLTGKVLHRAVYQMPMPSRIEPTKVAFRNGLQVDRKTKRATLRGRPFPLSAFHISGYGKDGKLHVQSTPFVSNGRYHMVCVPQQRLFLLMDNSMFHSTLVQMFLFERYDPAFFEPVDLNADAKLYRLKI